MRPVYNFILFLMMLVAALRGFAAEENGLGESLFLEGRLALLRGESWVLSRQNPDGSWQKNPALTAQAGMLLANSDAEYYAEHLQQAARWILNNEKLLNSAGEFAQALRLPLRLKHTEPGFLVKYFRQQKSSWDLAIETAACRQWLLEVHFLLPQELALLSAFEVEQLQQDFLREKERHPALALLTLLSRGNYQVVISELEVLRSACIAESASADPESLFWIVRALRAGERFFSGTGKSWRAAIVSGILDKQSGQGAFTVSGPQASDAGLSAAVFYLQVLQLCLAP